MSDIFVAGETGDKWWQYRSASDLNGYPYWGHFGTYTGGGYVAPLGTTITSAQTVLDELMNYRSGPHKKPLKLYHIHFTYMQGSISKFIEKY